MSHSLTLATPLIAQASEFVVVSAWSPQPGHPNTGGLSFEDFDNIQDAERAFRDYEAGEYARARAVCLFASRHGVPIGRLR